MGQAQPSGVAYRHLNVKVHKTKTDDWHLRSIVSEQRVYDPFAMLAAR